METYNNYPLVYLNVDEDLESRFAMNAIALVDNPATQESWFAFSATPTYKFASINKEQRMITAPVMLANTPIERFDKRLGKYYTAFTPETIMRMMKKYFIQNKQNNINEMHDGTRVVDGVYMVESFIVDNRNKTELFDVEPGSWIATFYFEDERYWNENVMSGKFKGISLEGSFDTVLSPEQTFKKWRSAPKSANVEKILYNDESRELVIRFHDGGTYTYSDVNMVLAKKILSGDGTCRTEGENRWGKWWVNKNPSFGAAVFTHLVETNHPFIKGGSFFSKEDAAKYLIEETLNLNVSNELKQETISNILKQI